MEKWSLQRAKAVPIGAQVPRGRNRTQPACDGFTTSQGCSWGLPEGSTKVPQGEHHLCTPTTASETPVLCFHSAPPVAPTQDSLKMPSGESGRLGENEKGSDHSVFSLLIFEPDIDYSSGSRVWSLRCRLDQTVDIIDSQHIIE